MARCRLQPHLVIECMIHLDEHRAPSFNNRQHIILICAFFSIVRSGLCGFKLAPRHNVASIRKGWYPTPVHQPCVPAAMVDVQMGAQDKVNLFGRNTCVGQSVQKAAIIAVMPMRKIFACFVVTNAAINENCVVPGTNQIALDGKNKTAGDGAYGPRDKPMTMRFDRFVGAVGEPF